jgi:hypothetical protein
MVTNFEYPDQMISWEGLSANGMKTYGRDRGILVHGTTGSILVDRTSYEVYDLNGKKTDEFVATADRASSGDLLSRASSGDLLSRDSMTDAHFANFIAAIQKGEALHSPIPVDSASGHIRNDADAMKQWAREYQPGWEVRV